MLVIKFQPTLPVREVTNLACESLRPFRISTHTSREGSDNIKMLIFGMLEDFNPHFP